MPRVLHLARRPLDGHPIWLAELQRRAGWESKVYLLDPRESGKRPYHTDFGPKDTAAFKRFVQGCNVLHLHGDMTLGDPHAKEAFSWLTDSAIAVQQFYRSTADMRPTLRRERALEREFWCMTAKKVALLAPHLPNLPTVVPTWKNELKPLISPRPRMKLAYTAGPGYHRLKRIFESLRQIIDIDVIEDLNWSETMKRCQHADIRLDDVAMEDCTQATFEGLAHGCITISGMLPALEELLPASFPGFRATIENVEQVITRIVNMSPEDRLHLQQAGPEWMAANANESVWHSAYESFYRNCHMQLGHDPNAVGVEIPTGKSFQVAGFEAIENAPDKQGGKLIVQVARTNCAGSIWQIHRAINATTNNRCRTITFADTTNGRKYPRDVLFGDTAEVTRLLTQADVVHFHNWIDHLSAEMAPYREILRGKRMVLQYHTEPRLLQPAFPRSDVVNRSDIPTLAIAQKHARFYPKSALVPNLINIDEELLTPSERVWIGGPLKVIYTPSDLKGYPDYSSTCCGKGFPETMPILQKLAQEKLIQLQVITDMRWEDLMPLKRQFDVCIDEMVTGGYHLCSLEALSQGLATFAWLDDDTQKALERVTGKTTLPWINTKLANFEVALRDLIAKGPEHLKAVKKASRQWMEQHWNPRTMVQHYINAYGLKEDRHVVQYFSRYNYLLPVYNVPDIIQDDLRRLEGAWRGRQVVIWGNGATAHEAMSRRPWDANAVHIGTNAATKLQGIDFSAYCISDIRFLKEPMKKEIALHAPGVRVYSSVLRPYLPEPFDASLLKTIGSEGFSSNLLRGIFHGYSVAYFALQLAAWTGASDILLAGCGHVYGPQLRFYPEEKPAPVDATLPRILHNYRALAPTLQQLGMRVRTIGQSRLSEAGIGSL